MGLELRMQVIPEGLLGPLHQAHPPSHPPPQREGSCQGRTLAPPGCPPGCTLSRGECRDPRPPSATRSRPILAGWHPGSSWEQPALPLFPPPAPLTNPKPRADPPAGPIPVAKPLPPLPPPWVACPLLCLLCPRCQKSCWAGLLGRSRLGSEHMAGGAQRPPVRARGAASGASPGAGRGAGQGLTPGSTPASLLLGCRLGKVGQWE